MKNNSLRPHVNFTVIKRSYLRVVVSTGSPGSVGIPFFDEKNRKANDSPCVFVFSIYSFFAPRVIWKPFNRLFNTENRKRFIPIFFVKEWSLGRIFFSYTVSY